MFWSKEEVFCVVGWVDMGLYICGPSYCYGPYVCCVYLILLVCLDNFWLIAFLPGNPMTVLWRWIYKLIVSSPKFDFSFAKPLSETCGFLVFIILDVIDSTSVGCYSIINKSHSQIFFFYWFVLDSQLLALYKQNFKGQRKYNQKSLTNQKRYSLLHINESWRDWLLAKETQLHNIRSKDWLSGSQFI